MILPKMKSPTTQLLDEVENLIRHGEGKKAQAALEPYLGKKLPREVHLRVAHLARRSYLALAALKMLNPVVRPSGKNSVEPTAAERVEYAAALTYIGGSEEALTLLGSIPAEEVPESLLYQAFALFAQWDYAASIPLLTKYLRCPGLDPYARLVGKVNLASALVYEEEWDRARYLLQDLLHGTGLRHWSLLQGNCLELAAHLHLLRKQFGKAEDFLNQAERRLQQSESMDAFFVDKWRAVMAFLRRPGDESARGRMRDLRALAVRKKHWETVRDLDRWLGLVRKDKDLLLHLYFGTPYEKWRERLLRDYREPLALPASYDWQLGSKTKQAPLDLLSGTGEGLKSSLTPGQTPHRLLAAFVSDFYRPQRLASLHFKLFPGEFFNPTSSPRRVHQTVSRLREWFKENEIPLNVLEDEGAYQLTSDSGYRIVITRGVAGGTKLLAAMKCLRREFTLQAFSAVQASKAIEASPRTTLRLLEQAITNQEIEKIGSGPQTRYRIKRSA